MKKSLQTTLLAIVIAVVAFVVLFSIFLTPEKTKENQTQNQTVPLRPQPQNQTQPIVECTFKFEDVELNDTFNWHNLSWNTAREINLTLYKTTLNFVERHGLKPIKTTITFRNNPFKIEKIESNLNTLPTKKTYVSYDDSVSKCSDMMLAAIHLGYFLGLTGIDARGAVTASPEHPEMVKTCRDASKDVTVIVVQNKDGCKPSITKQGNCIVLEAGNCYVLEVSEKLILDMIKISIEKGMIKAL